MQPITCVAFRKSVHGCIQNVAKYSNHHATFYTREKVSILLDTCWTAVGQRCPKNFRELIQNAAPCIIFDGQIFNPRGFIEPEGGKMTPLLSVMNVTLHVALQTQSVAFIELMQSFMKLMFT